MWTLSTSTKLQSTNAVYFYTQTPHYKTRPASHQMLCEFVAKHEVTGWTGLGSRQMFTSVRLQTWWFRIVCDLRRQSSGREHELLTDAWPLVHTVLDRKDAGYLVGLHSPYTDQLTSAQWPVGFWIHHNSVRITCTSLRNLPSSCFSLGNRRCYTPKNINTMKYYNCWNLTIKLVELWTLPNMLLHHKYCMGLIVVVSPVKCPIGETWHHLLPVKS